MSTDLHIVAVGARTPIGLSAESSAAAVRGGISRLRRQESPGGGSEETLCCDSVLAADLVGVERVVPLAQSALSEVLRKLAAIRLAAAITVPVLVGLPEDRPGWGRVESTKVLAAIASLSTASIRVAPEAMPLGHAAALEALRHAKFRLDQGQAALVVIGGVDSYFEPETLAWLRSNQQWLSEDVRSGFVPGEAAAFVALMRPGDARTSGLVGLASVRAVAAARETKLIKTDDVSLGEGLTTAVAEALAPIGRQLVDDVHCDINGERYRSEEWGFVAMRLASSFRDATAYRTAVGRWGDVGAATGALNLVLAVQAFQRLYAHGDHALVWGSSERGLRAAALLTRISRSS